VRTFSLQAIVDGVVLPALPRFGRMDTALVEIPRMLAPPVHVPGSLPGDVTGSAAQTVALKSWRASEAGEGPFG
jgi:hypothetical protein